jgi:hypothetical protein
MVTACYGIPVDPETHWIEGLVEDEITIYPYEKTELFFLQCDDVDGAQNGTYAHEEKLISAHEAGDFHMEMTPID